MCFKVTFQTPIAIQKVLLCCFMIALQTAKNLLALATFRQRSELNKNNILKSCRTGKDQYMLLHLNVKYHRCIMLSVVVVAESS